MGIKLFKTIWILTVGGLLLVSAYCYASFGETVSLAGYSLNRTTLFYVIVSISAIVNALSYLGKSNGFGMWLLGFVAMTNVFLIVSQGYIYVLNSGENYDMGRMNYLLYGSMALLALWLLSRPLFWFYKKNIPQQAVE